MSRADAVQASVAESHKRHSQAYVTDFFFAVHIVKVEIY